MTDSSDETDRSVDQTGETSGWRPSRRRLLEVGAATGAIAGFGNLAFGRQAQTYRFGGEVSAWTGQEPESIADEENPTLELTAGTEYEVVWENLDGAAHDFTIQDDQGETITATETMSEQGATRSLTFTATTEMAQYICTVHPNTMIGDIEVTEGATATPGAETETATGTEAATDTDTDTETETGTPGVGAGFFEAGAEVGVQQVADGPLTAPTDFADPDDGTGRFFVTDQTGELYLVRENGVRDEPLIDVSDRMVELGTFYGLYASQTQDYDERGLLGVATHPEFGDNGLLYLHYSAPPTEELRSIHWDHVEVVSEFAMSEGGDSVEPDSERQLLRIPHPQYNHDAGPMAFGPDDYLYVPMGDGGGANDDMYGHADDWYETNDGGNGQDLRHNLLGDVIRIDVDEGADNGTATPGGTPTGADTDEERPYGIPDDNPFVDEDDVMDEIYAYGFRNPFGIDFDSEGNLFVSDAGQNLWEEANVVERGGNYGWNVKEGTHCFSTEEPSDVEAITDCPESEPDEAPYDGSDLIDPVVEYPHVYQGQSVGITIVGGHRYENDTVAELQGAYVFGDWSADPARSEPLGRVFTAMPPDDFGADGTGTGTETPTDTATPAGTETAAGEETETPGGEEAPEIGPDDVPREDLWEMAELQFVDGFDWFVRQFGQDRNGEIYVLVNRRGVPDGETGAVLQIVPPEQGEDVTATETDGGS
ncbi:PQQ-dependent sugar dehydrogenase [Halosimplex sp. TS25]|uniref:PQQ-dependent sugar dehydrogenase n=1 Tax=Halosimplex rarum TaxID=3396619 RepID=UPI0039EC74B6